MIIILVGGIGSGKTLSVVKEIVSRKQKTFTNFDLYGMPYERLKYEHIFKQEVDGKKKIMKLNFDFWKKQTEKGGFDIYLDEFHNIMNSRRAMSKRNVILSDFLSQIRKVLGQSEVNNLYLITQKIKRIDVNSRDLAHWVIECDKHQFNDVLIPTKVIEDGKEVIKRLPMTVIYKRMFSSPESYNAFNEFGSNTCLSTTRFIANWYYKYFNSYELIDFGSEDYI